MQEMEFSIKYNVKAISALREFANIKGESFSSCKEVYFYRFVGCDNNYVNTVLEMERQINIQRQQDLLFYGRISGLPLLEDRSKIEQYSDMYEQWIRTGENIIQLSGRLPKSYESIVSGACKKIRTVYRRDNRNATPSQEKNFLVKILYWMFEVVNDRGTNWSPEKNIKIALENIQKKQEYFFAYFLTMLGIDVLLLQSVRDISGELENLGFSEKVVIGSFSAQILPAYVFETVQPAPVNLKRAAEPQVTEGPIRMKIPEHPGRKKYNTENRQTGRCNAPVPTASHSADTSSRREKSYEELAQLASSVVLIDVLNEQGEVAGCGSGIMIGRNGYILTNCHVAVRGVAYAVHIEEDEKVYVTTELIKYHKDLDLALIRIDRILEPLKIYQGKEKLVRGQKVVAIGSPLGLFNSVSDGIIAGFRVFGLINMIQFTAPISSGSSGGALLNMYGEVIGISTAEIDDGQNINLAMGYECINQFVQGFVQNA